MSANGMTVRPANTADGGAGKAAAGPGRVTCKAVWSALERASFAVESHVSADGEPRSSGVVYGVVDHRLYVAIAADGWKARQIETGQELSVTVPVRRGGILSLLLPIPPATITFLARATVHPVGSLDVASVSKELAKLVPEERKASSVILELEPEGQFLTYGIGVSLRDMRDPALARARVAVS